MSAMGMGSQKFSHGKLIHEEKTQSGTPGELPHLLQSFLLGVYKPQYDDITSVGCLNQATPVISAGSSL